MVEPSQSDNQPPESSETSDHEHKKAPPRDDSQATGHFKAGGFVIPEVQGMPFGMPPDPTLSYVVLPTGVDDSRQDVRWRIELEGLGRDHAPVGIDVVGDIVIGRGSGEPGAPDLDLEPYGAFEQGVSRHHAMLRPTRNSLYLIDLNSTNGTWHNALRLGSGFTHALVHNDTISLGRLNFTVKIIDRPRVEAGEARGTQRTPPAQPASTDVIHPETPEMSQSLPHAANNVELPTPPFGSLLKASGEADDPPEGAKDSSDHS